MPPSQRNTVLAALAGLAAAVVLIASYVAYLPSRAFAAQQLPPNARGNGAGACEMTFMSPSYLHLRSFEHANYTRLGQNSPWGLYLYREHGWDPSPADEAAVPATLRGAPVLFVPGNAGSFRQIRSLASVAARTFYARGNARRHSTPLDFFTIDFNEDFSAFHGHTVIDQSEYVADALRYILGTLYGHRHASVILVAHSMGGVVAREAFLRPQFPPKSVSTLITLSSPHVQPPVPIDYVMNDVYMEANKLWREGLRTDPHFEDVVVVSISGGSGDDQVASETTALAHVLRNAAHGFSVFTSSIPTVNSPVDHLAILWCNQLMTALSAALMDIANTPEYGALARVALLKEHLLGPQSRLPQHQLSNEVYEKVEGDLLVVAPSERWNIQHYRLEGGNKVGGPAWVFLASDNIYRTRPEFELFACSEDDVCHTAALETSERLPASSFQHYPSSLADFKSENTMSYWTVAPGAYYVLRVGVGSKWLVAQRQERPTVVQLNHSLLSLLLRSYTISLKPSIANQIYLPQLDTSLWRIKMSVIQKSNTQSFLAPLLKVETPNSSTIFETAYVVNVHTSVLESHTGGPYFVHDKIGKLLSIYAHPESHITVRFSLDLFGTMASLVMRYRVAILSLPFMFILCIFKKQLSHPESVLSFEEAMGQFFGKPLAHIVGGLTVLTFIQAQIIGALLDHPDFIDAHTVTFSFIQHVFLGGENAFLCVFVPVICYMGAFVTIVMYALLKLLVVGLSVFFNPSKASYRRLNIPGTWPGRLVSILLILGLALVIIPYQFAFLVIYALHVYQLSKSYRSSDKSYVNYQFGIVMLLTCLVPINGFVLVLWVRNIAVGFTAPFTADYQPLQIVGFLLHCDAILNWRSDKSVAWTVIPWPPFLVVAFLYSIRHLFMISYLAHALCIVLYVVVTF